MMAMILAAVKGEAMKVYRSVLTSLILVAAMVLLTVPTARGEEQDSAAPGRSVFFNQTPREWELQASVGHLPSARVQGPPGDISLTDYRFRATRSFNASDRMTLFLGGGYGLKAVAAPAEAALPHELHSMFLEAGGRYRINDRSFVSLRLYPGFYGDFRAQAADTLRMPLLALGGYSFDSGITLVGGLVYRFGYHSARFIPALGISYQPSENWRLDLIIPRPTISYLPSKQLQFFVAGDFANDEYEIKDPYGSNAMRYSDYKVLGGVSYLPSPQVKVSTAVGCAFDRRFVFYGGNRNDFRVDDVPFLKLSVDVGW
jgi:hypothetical protein